MCELISQINQNTDEHNLTFQKTRPTQPNDASSSTSSTSASFHPMYPQDLSAYYNYDYSNYNYPYSVQK